MSVHFKFDHDFDIDAKAYWDMFFTEPYNVDLYAALKMKDRKQLELKDEGKTIRRVVRLIPATEIPAIFRSVVSDMSYTEIDLMDKEKSSMDVKIEPSLMKDRFHMGGVYSVKPLGDNRCRRTFEGDVKVSIMLVGGKLEKFMVEEMRRSYEIAADVTRKFIAKLKAAPPVAPPVAPTT